MGECGCGEFHGDFKFKGPGSLTYVLQVYQSCDYCNTPAGIVLYKMTPEDCRDWDVDAIPELDIRDVGTLIGVVDPKKYQQKLIETGTIELDEYDVDFHSLFVGAVNDAIKENEYNTKNPADP